MSCTQYTLVVGSCDVLRRKVVEVVSNSTTVVGWLGYSLSKVCQVCRLAWLFGVEDVSEVWACVVIRSRRCVGVVGWRGGRRVWCRRMCCFCWSNDNVDYLVWFFSRRDQKERAGSMFDYQVMGES